MKSPVFLWVLAFAPLSLLGVENTTEAPDIRASIVEVNDMRSTGGNQSNCRIDISFSGDVAADAGYVRSVEVTKALDNVGRDLVSSTGAVNTDSIDIERRFKALRGRAVLRNPSRRSSTIKLLEGTVSFYTPTETNGGLVVLKNFTGTPGEPVVNETLKNNKVQLTFLTKEAFEAKKKEVEALQDKEIPEALGGFVRLLRGGFSSSFVYSKNALMILVQDPEKRIVDIIFCDKEGRKIQTRGRTISGGLWHIALEGPLPADVVAKVYISTPESLKTYPFSIQDIPLP